MKIIIRTLALLGLTLISLNVSASFDPPYRCPDDSRPRQSKEAAAGRIAWTFKCFPEYAKSINLSLDPNANFIQYMQGRISVYPAFGTIDKSGKVTIIKAPIDPNAECTALDDKAPGQKIGLVALCEGRFFN